VLAEICVPTMQTAILPVEIATQEGTPMGFVLVLPLHPLELPLQLQLELPPTLPPLPKHLPAPKHPLPLRLLLVLEQLRLLLLLRIV
jgi:hypothetical protein